MDTTFFESATVAFLISRALKGNHGNFFNDIAGFFDETTREKIRTKGTNFYETIEKAHSQIETRRFYLTTNIKWFVQGDDWKNLKSFICYKETATI